MPDQPYTEESLLAARQRFGRMVMAWMTSGGWSTKTAMQWSKAVGLPQLSNNTVSFIWNGTQPKTSPEFFARLGYLNMRLAAKDYGPIQDRKLKDRVSALQPLCHANGTPWTAVDFFACFIGQLDPPPQFDTGPPGKTKLLSPELAQRISSQKRHIFETHASARGLSKADAWSELKGYCKGLDAEQLDVLQQVLSGWRHWTPEELAGLMDAEGHNKAVLALQEWAGLDVCREFSELCSTP